MRPADDQAILRFFAGFHIAQTTAAVLGAHVFN